MSVIRKSTKIACFAVFVAFGLLPLGILAQKAPTEKSLPSPKPAATPAPKSTMETLTSVREVTDVKPSDPHFLALQSLIERYGIGGLTLNKKFNGTANLTGSDFQVIDSKVRGMLSVYLVGFNLPAAELEKWSPRNCPIDTKRLMFSEKVAADYLHCSYHPSVLGDLMPSTAALTRSRYVIFLEEVLGALFDRFGELEATLIKAREDAKKAAAPKPTPTPKPPLKLVHLSDRPGDFWNFVPGTWDADLVIEGKKIGRSHWKFSERSGNDFTLTMDIYSPKPLKMRVWTVKKPGTFYNPEHHTVNFEAGEYRFDGYIVAGGAMKGNVSQEGRSIGTWTAYRRVDVDYANLAEAAAKAKRNDEAIGYYSKAIQIKPMSGHFLNRGNLQYIENQYDAAIFDYSQSLIFDTTSEALYNRSLAYYKQKRYREAADDATRILTQFAAKLSAKRRAEVHLQRGWCHIGLNDKDAAIADFREALRIDPSSETAKKALNDVGARPQ